MVLSCEEGLVLSAWGAEKTKQVEVRAGVCAFMAAEIGTCSLQHCENVLCLRSVGAVLGDDWVAVAENAMSVTEERPEKLEVKHELKNPGGGDLSELHSRLAKDVKEVVEVVVAVLERKSGLEEGQYVLEKGKAVESAGSWERVGEVEKGSVKETEIDERISEEVTGFVGVDVDEADGRADNGGEGTVPNDTIQKNRMMAALLARTTCLPMAEAIA